MLHQLIKASIYDVFSRWNLSSGDFITK